MAANETPGLNVEQRKRLTIGVELAAKPELLLFLDEPTSRLDSQTSWAICDLMEKLSKNGQAVLCTVSRLQNVLISRLTRNRSINLRPCYSSVSTDYFSLPKVAELSILVKSEKMLLFVSLNDTVESYSGARNTYSILCSLEW